MKRMNLLVFLMILFIGQAKSEGTKQLSPSSSDISLLIINDSEFGNFASFNGPEESKLCFEISSLSEEVFLGLSPSVFFNGEINGLSYYFRIVDEIGNVVHGPFEVNPENYNATDYATTIAGPDVIDPAGYSVANPIFHFQPTSTGKYCIEFNLLSTVPNPLIMLIRDFDITIADFDGANFTAIDGRIYSQKWAVRTPNIAPDDDFDRAFNGQVYDYTANGFVSKINFANSGFQGLAFNIAFNSFGTQNSGDIIEDRRSLEDQNSVIGEHLVFLNNPDPNIYPSGLVGCIIAGPVLLSCESTCIQIEVSQPGQVDIIIDIDSDSGPGIYDPNSADVALALLVTEDDVSEGNFMTCVPWDGLDGFGNEVDLEQNVAIYAIYSQGVSHFAVYDVELNLNGFQVDVVRPVPKSSLTPDLFYDDSNLTINNDPGTGAPLVDLNGCTAPCHNWNNLADEDVPGYGNFNTINTWWQINTDIASNIEPADCPLVLEKDSLLLDCGQSGSVFVLLNDFSEITDIDPSTLEIVSSPNNGIASVNPDGSISYDPDDNFSGRDTMIYRVCNELTPEPQCDIEFVCLVVFGDETEVSCASDLDLECGDPGNIDIIEDWLDFFSATNDCDDLILSHDYTGTTGGCGGETGIAIVTFTATDESGNETTCQSTLTIEDTQPPEVDQCPVLDSSIDCVGAAGNINAANEWNDDNIALLEECAFDSCDPDLEGQVTSDYTYDNLEIECGITGTIDVVYTVTDDCGNSTTYEATFTIVDNTPPTGDFPTDVTVQCDQDPFNLAITGEVTNVDEECSGEYVDYSDDINLSSCNGTGTIDRLWTITDDCGNQASAIQTITLIDDTAPEFDDPSDITLGCDEDPFDLDLTGRVTNESDNCGGVTVNYVDDLSDYDSAANQGCILRTWIVTDACGNSAESDQDICIEECSGSIGDYIWEDLDGDGIQDPNEPGIPDVKLVLIQNSEEISCEFTDDNGYYLFENVPPGDYCLQVILPEGYDLTDPFQGNNGASDSDFEETVEGVKTPIFNLSGGENELDQDGGLFRCVIIGDFVWYDIDTDDLQDPEENGINGLQVHLYSSSGELIETTLTGHKPGTPSDDGYYEFCARPGCYYVKIFLPPFGLVLAQTNEGGNDNIDNDFGHYNGPITTPTFCVSSGGSMIDYDAGFYPMAEMGDVVWLDEDVNGVQDPHEAGMEGVIVNCYNLADELITSTVTGDNGGYNIDYLQQEPYYLEFIPPEGYSPTIANASDDSMDSDVDGTNGPWTTAFYNMESGVQVPSIDAGFQIGSLPIELVAFEGQWKNDHNHITWKTSNEINNDYFILERSIDVNAEFKTIGVIEGSGNSSFEQSYSFDDYDLNQSGTYFYRLKQVDFNGKISDEGTIAIEVELLKSETIEVYPNPSHGFINLTISALTFGNQIEVDLLSSEGKIIRNDLITESSSNLNFQAKINLDSVSKGVYILRVKVSDRVYFKRLILLY